MITSYWDRDLTEEEYHILRAFYPEAREMMIKEIQKRSGYSSYERVNHYLGQLAKKGILFEKKMGRTLVYSVKVETWSAKMGFYLYAGDRAKEFWQKNKDICSALKEIPEEETDIVMIFGSYSKGTQKKESDIDLIIVTSQKEKIESSIASIKRRHGLDIQAIILPKLEFAKIKKENVELWNDLLNYGVIFKGQELFYYYAYAA